MEPLSVNNSSMLSLCNLHTLSDMVALVSFGGCPCPAEILSISWKLNDLF
jgi:hypothetical protein